MAGRTRSRPRRPVRRSVKPKSPADQGSAPRLRIVAGATALLSERGLAGASFFEVIERSGAPRGSIYHHSPEGKDRLAAEAIELVGGHVLGLLRQGEGATPRQVVHRFVDAWRAVLVKSDCNAGCAIAAVANERLEHPELAARAAAVFVAWERELKEMLVAAGGLADQASPAATRTSAAVRVG